MDDDKKVRALNIVKRLQVADGTEEELHELMRELKEISPDPNISDLIFWHRPELSAEEIVGLAFAYSPIRLPGGRDE